MWRTCSKIWVRFLKPFPLNANFLHPFGFLREACPVTIARAGDGMAHQVRLYPLAPGLRPESTDPETNGAANRASAPVAEKHHAHA